MPYALFHEARSLRNILETSISIPVVTLILGPRLQAIGVCRRQPCVESIESIPLLLLQFADMMKEKMVAQRQATNFEFLAGNLQTHHAVETENKMRIFAELSGDWNHSAYFVYNKLLAVGLWNNINNLTWHLFGLFEGQKMFDMRKEGFC